MKMNHKQAAAPIRTARNSTKVHSQRQQGHAKPQHTEGKPVEDLEPRPAKPAHFDTLMPGNLARTFAFTEAATGLPLARASAFRAWEASGIG